MTGTRGNPAIMKARAVLDSMVSVPVSSAEGAREECAQMHGAGRMAVLAVADHLGLKLRDPDDIGAALTAFRKAGVALPDDLMSSQQLTDHADSRGRKRGAAWTTVEDAEVGAGMAWDEADELVEWARWVVRNDR